MSRREENRTKTSGAELDWGLVRPSGRGGNGQVFGTPWRLTWSGWRTWWNNIALPFTRREDLGELAHLGLEAAVRVG